MASYMIARSVCNTLRNNSIITNNTVIPTTINTLPCVSENNFRSSSDSVMLRNLRMAITPSYGTGTNIYENVKIDHCSTSLAGDPKRLRTCQDIRADILEKWNQKPKPESQREWINNLLFKNVVF